MDGAGAGLHHCSLVAISSARQLSVTEAVRIRTASSSAEAAHRRDSLFPSYVRTCICTHCKESIDLIQYLIAKAMTALSVSVPGSISNAGHISRMSSLPSIDEDDSNNAPAAAQHHRRAPSAFSSKPRFSLKSLGSISTNSDSSHAASVSLTSKDLPSNMMTSYKDRDPYEKYTVLESLGKGSIGSVEKVVRRHHHKRHDYNSSGKSQRHGWIGGIFHDCCVISSEDEGAQQKKKPSFLQSLISKLRNNSSSDAFESIEQSPSVNTSDSYRSNMSENSAFSAPTTLDHANNNGNGLDVTHASSHPWTSIRSDTPKQRHTAQHTLRRYALKSIRLDRTEHNNSLSKADEAELRNEISILRQLDHPHIVHILEVYYHKRAIYLLIDLCEGGDLYVMDPYVEGEARSVMKQLCMAVSYMHRRGVVHRDLKYENVMFVERAERSRLSIKVCAWVFWCVVFLVCLLISDGPHVGYSLLILAYQWNMVGVKRAWVISWGQSIQWRECLWWYGLYTFHWVHLISLISYLATKTIQQLDPRWFEGTTTTKQICGH